MNLETVTALTGIAVSMTWTPGPNNAMLSASGANYGWRRSLPHVMGVAIGFPIMLTLVALGLERVLEAFPIVVEILSWIGLTMMVWFAWRIATAHAARENARSRPFTFLEAIVFQWVNPKAWALAIYITAGYAVGETAFSNTLLGGQCVPRLGLRFVLYMGRVRRRNRQSAQAGLAIASLQHRDGVLVAVLRDLADVELLRHR